MRLPAVERWVVLQLISASQGKVEKQDFMTKALEKFYRCKPIRENWGPFIDRLVSILTDATIEARVSRQWTHEGGK